MSWEPAARPFGERFDVGEQLACHDPVTERNIIVMASQFAGYDMAVGFVEDFIAIVELFDLCG